MKKVKEEKYALAVELYRETELPLSEIAARCSLNRYSIASHIRRWHPEEMERRRLLREERWKAKRLERESSTKTISATYLARLRYGPAIGLLQAGWTLSQAAKELNVDLRNLSAWFKKKHPEILEETGAGMMDLPSGKKTLRRTYERFFPIAQYIETHPSKSTKELCQKFNVPVSSLIQYISTYFPEQWQRHCAACADKAARLRRRKKRAKS